jgi:Mrp family chromosome partitioning ATPase
MSKNFELLQQIGNDEELFRTAMKSKDAAMAEEFEVASALDQGTFETLMEKAALMGLLQTSNDPSEQTLPQRTEIGSDTGLGRSPRKSVRETATQAASLPNKFQAGGKPKDVSGTAIEEPAAVPGMNMQQRNYPDISLSHPWLDSLKNAAKRCEWKERVRRNHGGADLEAITREQEIKLVERVFPGAADSPRVALFAGLENEARCTSTCARVAELLAARAEGPVCVVDANFLRPSLHEYFGVDNLKGLAEATVESGPVQNFAQQIPEPDLWLISSGKAAAQLRFPAMADGLRVRIEELRDTFRYVVIHSAPLRVETSAMLLSHWTDGIVLVVEAHATRRDVARRVKGMLDAANVSLLGVVLNNRTFPIPEAIYRRL